MGQKPRKVNFFEKFLPKSLQNEKFALSLHSQSNQWWIHLRARIRASHARHRGSNPLSTTKDAEYQRLIFLSIFQTFYLDVRRIVTTFFVRACYASGGSHSPHPSYGIRRRGVDFIPYSNLSE